MNRKNTAALIKSDLQRFSEPHKIAGKEKFFKVAPGEYAEGDIFIAVSNGDVRKAAKDNIDASLSEVIKLLKSKIHEHRLTGLIILVEKYQRACKKKTWDPKAQKTICDFYLANLYAVNNWDLVDLSAHYILGAYLLERKDRGVIYHLASSGELWKERVAIISTFAFIRNNDYLDTLKLAKMFLSHEHDLIHKAVGWMLREIGKRDQATEEKFLKKHYKQMPRTMLRYAIEKFPEPLRQKYLKGNI